MIIPVYAQYTATIQGQVCTTMHNLGEQVQPSNVFCLYPLNLQMEAMVYLVIGITIAFLLTATMIFSVCQCITKNSRSNAEASKLANITVSIQKFTKKCMDFGLGGFLTKGNFGCQRIFGVRNPQSQKSTKTTYIFNFTIFPTFRASHQQQLQTLNLIEEVVEVI